MLKKSLFSFLVFSLLFMSAPAANADTQVCGIDNITYDSRDSAETVGVDVSYEFACIAVTSEANLYEAKTDVNFAGTLIEIGSTDLPTTIIIRENGTNEDFTVNVNADTLMARSEEQYTKLTEWIPGDQVRVIGKRNENTETVDSNILINLSIVVSSHWHANGWITNIDLDAKEITYQWNYKETIFKYDETTRFVAGLKNPAGAEDIRIGDRIRGRLLRGEKDASLAKIIVVLRRGNDLFMKIRTFRPNATLIRLDSTIIPTTIQVRVDKTLGLKANDVNNLIGAEGSLVTINVNENTKIVRKYFGNITLDEFSVGDKMRIVGRINDDGTVDAKIIKNNSIWKTSTQGYAGVVNEVDVDKGQLVVNWSPVKHITRKKLIDKLSGAVSAQSVSMASLRDGLQRRIYNFSPYQVGKFNRNIKYKKVKIDRINKPGVKIGHLITHLPIQKIRVDINNTHRPGGTSKIIIGTNNNASISDIQIGDKVRIRGVMHDSLPIVVAETVVVVNSLPEIDESLDLEINDLNELVSEIYTDDTANALTENTSTNTEEEIVDIMISYGDDDIDVTEGADTASSTEEEIITKEVLPEAEDVEEEEEEEVVPDIPGILP